MPFVAPENMAFARLGQPKPPRNRHSPDSIVVHSNIPCPRKTFTLLKTPNKGRKNEEFACSQFMTLRLFVGSQMTPETHQVMTLGKIMVEKVKTTFQT